MDFRVRNLREFSRPERSLQAVLERAPQAEALAASWIEGSRPVWSRVYAHRRRIATFAVVAIAVSLLVHVVFGANGMVVYRHKHAAFDGLKKQIVEVQQENDRYAGEIQGLKSDQTTIEKEAREQLGYAKPGEYVYVAPAPAKPTPPGNHSARK